MVPEDENQLKQFVSQAESAQKVTRKVHGSFGAGKPWAKGIVKFCYHENVPDGREIWKEGMIWMSRL